MSVKLAIPKEIHPGERRVALTPGSCRSLIQKGYSVQVESGAGENASFSNDAYLAAGCIVEREVEKLWSQADILCKIREPRLHPKILRHEAELLREGGSLIAMIWPRQNAPLLAKFAGRHSYVLAMDCIPNNDAGREFNVMASLERVIGYRAIVEAASELNRFFSSQPTSVGTLPPAKVLVIGNRPSARSAVETAVGLGATVSAWSLDQAQHRRLREVGARILPIDASDNTISHAQILSQLAPTFDVIVLGEFDEQRDHESGARKLLSERAVSAMATGSVVLDLITPNGGNNCAVTQPNQRLLHQGTTVIGYTDFPSRMATVSSELYSAHLEHILGGQLLSTIGDTIGLSPLADHPVLGPALILRDGSLVAT